MKILESLSYDDLLLVPQYSGVISRNDVDLSGKISIHTTTLPIIASPMDTISTSHMSVAMDKAGGFAIIHRNLSIEEQCREVTKAYEGGAKIVSAAIGMSGDYLERAQQLFSICGCSILCVDVAHGDHILMKEALKQLKERFPGVYLIAGNVATANGFLRLSQWGADAIRVGIGSGSICSSRLNAGSGVPVAQSIIDCEEVREMLKLNTLIIADGGCKNAGDIVKALALGADYAMLGSLLAGTDECPGSICYNRDGSLNAATTGRHKLYRGMASIQALGRANRSIEGISAYVPYQGPVSNVLDSLAHNIRSGLSYNGAYTIPELQRKAVFTRQTALGMKETRTHINER